MSIVKQIRERLTLISLSEQEYVSALEATSSGTIVGAAAYDALIAHCALKAGADVLLTWNVRDFTRFGAAIARPRGFQTLLTPKRRVFACNLSVTLSLVLLLTPYLLHLPCLDDRGARE